MKKNLLKIAIGLTLFLLFTLFSYLVHKNFFTQFDFNSTVRLQDHISRRLDDLFSVFSLIGSFEILTIVLLAILALRKKLLSVLVLFFYGLTHFIEIFGKVFVEHFPPPHFMLRTEKLVDFPQFYVSAQNSYPSGHAARTAFVSIILAALIGNSKKLSKNQKYTFYFLIFAFDVIMFTSRVYLGEHWTTDVAGGALLGFAAAFFSIVFI